MSEQKNEWIGRTIAGKYLLGKYLGGTDHGAVFASEIVHARTTPVAVKLIPTATVDAEKQLSRWRELIAVSNASLVRIHDCGKCELDGEAHIFVVQEYADEDLGDLLPQRSLSPEEVRGMIEPVIETLAFLHEQNLVHARIHPGNILASGDQIKLTSDSITPGGEAAALAKPVEGFSAPEWNEETVNPAGDIWSLGATVVAALTQKPPVFAEHHGGLVLPDEVKDPFARIARECLKKEVSQRPSIAKVRSLLIAPVTPAAKEMPRQAVKEAKKELVKSEPAAMPVAKVPPVPTPSQERKAPVSPVSPVRPMQATAQKKSYLLPGAAIAIAAVLLLAVPRMFKQKSNAAGSPPAANSHEAKTTASAKPAIASASGSAKKTDQKGAHAEPSLTETSHSVSAEPAAIAKKPSKTSGGAATKGEVLDQVLPDVSEKARATIQGKVRLSLRLHVNPDGTVSSAEPEPPAASKYFTEQAIKAAKRWQFSAPEVNGHSVDSEWILHFEFTPSVTDVRPAQVSP